MRYAKWQSVAPTYRMHEGWGEAGMGVGGGGACGEGATAPCTHPCTHSGGDQQLQ